MQKLLINDLKSNNSEVMSNNEKQIEEMARIICKPTPNKGNCDKCGFKKQCSKFDDATDLYNAGYRKQEWISVDERLPEDGEIVLTVDSEGEREVCFYEEAMKGIFQRFGGLVKIFNITHWMPLPEAPKGGAE